MNTNKTLLWLGTFVYAFVLLLFLSPDSYLYDLFGRCDSAWFFMCGKAWMNGMVPYVDFADSKGPLLWLIYGVGYMFSPHSFVGVFWLSVVVYAATFSLAYKLTRLVADRRVVLGVLVLLPIALLFRFVHKEVRAEDFCYPLAMACLYLSVLVAKEKERRLFWPAYGIGACLMASLLIKWSITLMLSGTAFVILVFSLKRKDYKGILGGLYGLCTIAIPFVIYFLWQGNLSAFFQEYFLNTYTTVSHQPLTERLIEKGMHLGGRFFIVSFTVTILGFVIFCYRYKQSWWLCAIPLPFTLLIATPGFAYYYSILMPLMVVPCIVTADIMLERILMRPKLLRLSCVIVVIVGMFLNFHRHPFRFEQTAERSAYHSMEKIMAQVINPRLTIYPMDNGLGIVAHALPANKYWALQNGYTSSMLAERKEALRKRKADFIIVLRTSRTDKASISEEELSKNGYSFSGVTVSESGQLNLYVYRKDGGERQHHKGKTK